MENIIILPEHFENILKEIIGVIESLDKDDIDKS
jgi:hypothetical protein